MRVEGHEFQSTEALRFRLDTDTDRQGEYFGWVRIRGDEWAIVLFDGKYHPELIWPAKIELLEANWKPLKLNLARSEQ